MSDASLMFDLEDDCSHETDSFSNITASENTGRICILTHSFHSKFNLAIDDYKPEDNSDNHSDLSLDPLEEFVSKRDGFVYDENDVTLCLTNFRIIFILKDNLKTYNHSFYLFNINNVVINTLNKSTELKYSVTFLFKDIRLFILKIKNNVSQCLKFIEVLQDNIKLFNPIHFIKQLTINDVGWNIYNIYDEFSRFNIKDNWKIVNYNENYDICNSYPSACILPRNVTKEMLSCSANFRTNGRFPSLTWLNKNGNALLRSSQPLIGFTGKSDSDVMLLKLHCNNMKLHIFDCRDYFSALGNKLLNAGYENQNDYPFTSIDWLNIPNIHSVKSSYDQCYVIYLSNKSVLPALYNTNWLQYIQRLLQSTLTVVNALKNESVLVHCSDGWDRTSQICSLVELYLDNYYRTLKGFIILIEKDWLSFGHQFSSRNGITHDNDSISPIFLQFLHCVHCLLKQNHSAFEFNDALLQLLADEMNNCRYGTFIYNNEKERKENKVMFRFRSIWDDVIGNEEYINKQYKQTDEITINCTMLCISSWSNYYQRHSNTEVSHLSLY